MSQYLTPDEYAQKHGVSGACVRLWIAQGVLEALPPSPSYRIPADAPRPKKVMGRPKAAAQVQSSTRVKKARKKSAQRA